MDNLKIITIILISIIFITFFIIFNRDPGFKYNVLIKEKSIKISKSIANLEKNSKNRKKINISKDRTLTGYTDLTGNYSKFINNFDIDQRLKNWFINQTKDFDSVYEVILGNDGQIQKVYYTHNDIIYGYKIDKKTKKEEYAYYITKGSSLDLFMDFISLEEFNQLIKIIPEIMSQTDFVVNYVDRKYPKALHLDIPPFIIIKLNNNKLKEIIKVLGYESRELNDFLNNNSDKYLTYISIGRKNKDLTLYYLDEKNYKIKNKMNEFF